MKYNYSREIETADKIYDTIVVGGGPAGVNAAIAAARNGIDVLLIENLGCLGGMGSSGMVSAFNPMSDGKHRLVQGIMGEIVDKLMERGFLAPYVTKDIYTSHYHEWTPYSIEGYKMLLDEMVTFAGVELLFFSKVVDVDSKDGQINGVFVSNVEGLTYYKAKTVIDCSGDAIVASFAGAPVREAGVDTKVPMPATLCCQLSSVDWEKAVEMGMEYCGFDREGYQHSILKKAVKEGFFTQKDLHLPGVAQTGKHSACMNAGHIFGLDALNIHKLTEGMIKGRKIIREYAEFYKKYIPGFEDVELISSATLMGIRESRRILGEYELNLEDFQAIRHFSDQIGVFNNFIDIHPYESTEKEYKRFEKMAYKNGVLGEGKYLGIPYGILVPKGWKNLWVAGRSASSDIYVNGALRVMPCCGMMGQAAGTAASISIKTGMNAKNIDCKVLVKQLRKDGAYLPQEELSPILTTN